MSGAIPHQDYNGGRISVVYLPAFRALRKLRGGPHGPWDSLPQRADRRIAPDIGTEQSLTTAKSSEENGIVERANQEVLRHLNAILFDSRVHDK